MFAGFRLRTHPLPSDQILNVNVPDLPLEQIKGIKVTLIGQSSSR